MKSAARLERDRERPEPTDKEREVLRLLSTSERVEKKEVARILGGWLNVDKFLVKFDHYAVWETRSYIGALKKINPLDGRAFDEMGVIGE